MRTEVRAHLSRLFPRKARFPFQAGDLAQHSLAVICSQGRRADEVEQPAVVVQSKHQMRDSVPLDDDAANHTVDCTKSFDLEHGPAGAWLIRKVEAFGDDAV